MSIIYYLLLLIAPALTAYYALKSKTASAFGAKNGFQCPTALTSNEAWAQAQKLASSRLIIASVLMAAIGIAFMLVMPSEDTVSLLMCAGIAFGIQIITLMVVMVSIEMGLQSRFTASVK
ncbi:MAG: SdpI family protein [Clostridia bacterium]|nr:SdpI family protein [Clostridia bacterium]